MLLHVIVTSDTTTIGENYVMSLHCAVFNVAVSCCTYWTGDEAKLALAEISAKAPDGSHTFRHTIR